MNMRKLSLMPVALLTATTGAWAQNSDEITVTPVTGQTNKWTFTMPAESISICNAPSAQRVLWALPEEHHRLSKAQASLALH